MSMAKQVTKTAVPRLRFPEFHEADSWKPTKLSELLRERKQRNRDLKFGTDEVLSVSGEHGCVNQIELLGRSYAGASVKEYHVVETGDLVYTKSPLKKNPYGIIKENKGEPGIVSTLYAVYHVTESAHSTYLDHYFSRDFHLNSYLQPIVRKGAKNDMKVNNSAVLSGEVLAPNKLEQKKIADCLTSLDEVIAAQGRKVEALKAHKRGLMQQLFPREGETCPRLRFPEFRNAPEWDEESVSALISTVTPPKKIATSGYKSSGRLAIVDQSPAAVCGWTDDLSAKVDASLPLLVFGDHTCVLKLVEHDFAQGADGIKIISAKPRIDIRFLFFGLQADPIVSSSYRRHFSLLQEKSLALPRDAAEQQRIADCLSSLDTRITAETQQLAALKTHKQGLMQQLFPVPEVG